VASDKRQETGIAPASTTERLLKAWLISMAARLGAIPLATLLTTKNRKPASCLVLLAEPLCTAIPTVLYTEPFLFLPAPSRHSSLLLGRDFAAGHDSSNASQTQKQQRLVQPERKHTMSKIPVIRHAALSTLGTALLFPALSQAAFLEDSKANLNLRNFYINQDVRNEDRGGAEEWGQAFTLDYKSGFTEGKVGFGLDVLASYAVRLDAGGDEDKSLAVVDRRPGSVFPLESNGRAKRDFGRVGVTGKIRFSETVAHFGTLQPKLPVVTPSDGRLLPQTFQGAQITSKEIKDLTLIAGKLERSTERNSSDSSGLSIGGANSGSKAQFSNEFYYGGADYKVTKDLLLQYYYGNLRDFYKQHFLGLVHNWQLPVGSLKTDLRYFYSDSDGENSTASGRAEGYVSSGSPGGNGEVDNNLWSAMFTYSLKGHALSAGYQKSSGNSDFPNLNKGTGRTLHLITNAQIGKFSSAGENTWVTGYSYDFKEIGIPGLKAGVTYFSGDDIDANGSDKREWERDVRVDYKVQEGMLKGVGFTWRNAMLRGNDTRDQDENRLIVNYSIPLL